MEIYKIVIFFFISLTTWNIFFLIAATSWWIVDELLTSCSVHRALLYSDNYTLEIKCFFIILMTHIPSNRVSSRCKCRNCCM